MARSAELLDRGPARQHPQTFKQRLRVRLRDGLLRALRPYSAYQKELDENIVAAMAHQRERIERLEIFAADLIASADALRRRIAHAEQELDSEQQLTRGLRALPYIAGDPFGRFQAPVGNAIGYAEPPPDVGRESAHAYFDDVFRGPAERVAELHRPYVSLVAGHQPVLDAGCGRGEFLTLLRAEGIIAQGIDRDPGMVARCRAQGLDVVEGDVIERLGACHDAGLGTVFSAHLIEHLRLEGLNRLLDLARRKLEPGGLFIAETVNPHSVAALKTFWVNPSDRRPIFPEVALALCACAGFAPAYVFAPGHEDFERARFDATTYAVVATSPAPST